MMTNTNAAAKKSSKKELARAWKAVEAHDIALGLDGLADDDFEGWSYMGCFSGNHQFRHRSHPVHGRFVLEIPAAE